MTPKPITYFVVLILAFTVLSCASQKGMKWFFLDAPKGYTSSENTGDHGFSENYYTYSDGSILFITNVIDSGSHTNHDNRLKKYGRDIYLMFAISDSLDIQGERDGLFWREMKKDYLVYGYLNVPEEKKELFDQLIENGVSVR